MPRPYYWGRETLRRLCACMPGRLPGDAVRIEFVPTFPRSLRVSDSMKTTTTTRSRVVRYALVVAATAAVSFPLVSQRLRAQDEPAPAAAAADEAAPAKDD